MKEVKMGVYTYNEESYNFNFYTNLSSSEKLQFVKSVVNTLVDDENYNSIIRELIFDYFTVKFFTEIDTSKLDESETFVDDTEEFLLSTNIIEIVKANASPALFDELNEAIDNSIAYLTGIHINPLNKALAHLVNTLERKINEVDLESMMNMAKAFSGMGEDFTLENAINYMTSDAYKNNATKTIDRDKMAEFAEDMDKAIKVVGKNKKNKK